MQGIGTMLYRPYCKTAKSPDTYYGRTIVSAVLVDNKLQIDFTDGTKIEIFDNGQCCSEDRYISTDDDLSSLIGHVLLRIEAKNGPEKEGGYGTHETCFIEVGTDVGFITLTNHNEHNGFYGGFVLTIQEGESQG